MKGVFAWVGFDTKTVKYVRQQRGAGKTKFSGFRLWNFALEEITSFSAAPLKIWTYIGLVCALFGIIYSIFIFTRVIMFGIEAPGYASTIIAVMFFGSLNLVSIGFLGEYVTRIYSEVKARPLYIVNRYHKRDANDEI